jgi:fucose permease
MAVIELVSSSTAFWHATADVFRAANPRSSDSKDNRMKEALIRLPHARVTWVCAIFLLGYVGIEVALGGWIVKFMLEIRDGEEFASGMVATGFWMGVTVGRIVLGFVTPRLGEKLAIAVRLSLPMSYLIDAIGDEVLTHPTRSTSHSPWRSNSSSGSYPSSTSQPLQCLSKGSSLAHCSLPPSSRPLSFCHAICTSVLSDLQRRLEGLERLYSPLPLERLRSQRVCRSCSPLFWRCWV